MSELILSYFDYAQLLISMSLVSSIAKSISNPKLMIAIQFKSLFTNLRKITFFFSFGGDNLTLINLFMTYFFNFDFALELICDMAVGL